MFRKLANIFNQNQSSKILDFAQVNRSNNQISLSYLTHLSPLLKSASSRSQLLKQLQRGWSSPHWQQRLKFLIVTHHLVTTTLDDEIAEIYTKQMPKIGDTATGNQGSDAWVRRELVEYYAEYLRKLCMHFQMYEQFRRGLKVGFEELMEIELTAECFKAVNLINFILKSQINLNKVGRYYPKLLIMCQLFGMYVKDIKIFYQQLSLVIDSIMLQYPDLPNEMLRHSFVFLVETQKTFDRLQQFFHNRYFYRNIDVPFPLIRNIDPMKYKLLVRYIRVTDRTIDIPRVCTVVRRRKGSRGAGGGGGGIMGGGIMEIEDQGRGTAGMKVGVNQTCGEMSAETNFQERFEAYREV